MPNTITIAAQLTLTHSTGLAIPILPPQNLTFTQSGEGEAGGIQNIGTSAENLNVGDVATEGFAVFKNLDPTNFVEIGWDATGFQSAFKLLAGMIAVVPLNPSRTWQAKADTAAVELFYRVLEA
jgi:hypothetical protein